MQPAASSQQPAAASSAVCQRALLSRAPWGWGTGTPLATVPLAPAIERVAASVAAQQADRMQPAWLGRLVVFSACVHGGLMQADHMHALPSPGCGRQPPVDPAVGRGQYLDLEVDG
eukprot:COSAG01_NODE_29129_length_644_cov_5.407339_1_plen_115_part_10